MNYLWWSAVECFAENFCVTDLLPGERSVEGIQSVTGAVDNQGVFLTIV